ncbi:MAG: helix-turn-helix domain-containing protein [Candidatus Poribacteria bacterium]|nr:helix-turn-helix domain-containing protein [Candidatus Poribacteria bacterium]
MKNPYVIDSFRLKSGERIYLANLEKHGLSIVPCDHDSPAVDRYAHLWNARKQVTLSSYGETETDHYVFKQMQGVQIMTGQPTFLPSETSPSKYLYLMDFDIENHLKTSYPEHYERLITTIYALHGDRTPCHVRTKSDGDRFSLFVPGFHKKVVYQDSTSGEMLFEFFSKNGLSRLDNRYSLVSGSLFDIPQFHLPQDINPLTEAICKILDEIGGRHQSKSTQDAEVVETSQIGELDINWVEATIDREDGTSLDVLVSQNFPTENCQMTDHTSNRNEVAFTKFPNGSIRGYCFNCEEPWWEVKKAERHKSAPVRLKVSDCERETQSLEVQRETLARDIQAVVAEKRNAEGQHVVNVTSAAGSGKTTLMITTYDNLFFLSKTTEEADQAFAIADSREKDCWRHRPRIHNRKEDNWDTLPFGLDANERPCMYPTVCNDLVIRGHEVVPTFCAQKCEYYSECRKVGFLKQLEIEPNKQSVFMSWNEMVFSDVRFASRVKKICAGNEKLLVLDEANATQLPQQRVIPQKDLLNILESWRLFVPATYDISFALKKLIEALSTAKKTDKIREAFGKSIQLLSDDNIATIDDALSKIPVVIVWKRDSKLEELYAIAIYGDTEKRLCLSDDVAETPAEGFDGTIPRAFAENGVTVDKMTVLKVDLPMFEQFGFCDMRKDAHTVPRRLVNFFSDIKTFVDSESKACFKLDNGDIEFYLPPALNAKIGLTLTASDPDDLIAEVYRPTDIEVTTITAPPPPFMSGCKVFQIATGRYTAKSALIEQGGERVRYKPDGTEVIESVWQPKPLFKRMLNTIHKAVKRETVYRDTLVVAAKDIVENTEDPLIEELKENLFIDFVNHHHAEGRNDYQHCDLAFIFHFEPSITEIQKLAQIAFPNEDLSFKREEIDITVDGVTLEKVMRYTDERVQKVYNRECESRLMQAIMRLRPMIHENKLIFLFTAEPVRRIPIAPIPFTLPQLERFLDKEQGDIVNFEDHLNELETLSMKEQAEQEGISERAMYYKKGQDKKKDKEALKAEAYRLHTEEGLSYREIACRLNMRSHTTISRWFNKDN